MAVVGLDGKEVKQLTAKEKLIERLMALVNDLEEGTLVIDRFFMIAEVTNPNDRRKVTHPTWDSDLTVEEVVFLLEVAKADIFQMMNA